MNLYVYNKDLKLIHILPVPESYKEDDFNNLFPMLKDETIYTSGFSIINPIIENGIIREKTKVELAMEQDGILVDGEYIEDEEIKYIPKPENYLKAIWNKESKKWEDKATLEDIKSYFNSKITEYVNVVIIDAGYDNISTVNVWANSEGSFCQAEAKKLVKWYMDVWEKCLEIQEKALSTGNIPSLDEIIKELPILGE